jgi:hypothetical protein
VGQLRLSRAFQAKSRKCVETAFTVQKLWWSAR